MHIDQLFAFYNQIVLKTCVGNFPPLFSIASNILQSNKHFLNVITLTLNSDRCNSLLMTSKLKYIGVQTFHIPSHIIRLTVELFLPTLTSQISDELHSILSTHLAQQLTKDLKRYFCYGSKA